MTCQSTLFAVVETMRLSASYNWLIFLKSEGDKEFLLLMLFIDVEPVVSSTIT